MLATDRFDSECTGWACISVVDADLSSAEAIRVRPGFWEVVHPTEGMLAVTSGGTVIYPHHGVAPGHEQDLFAVSLGAAGWGDPLPLTGESPFLWHINPAVSDDGGSVVFQCANEVWDHHSICEVGIDGQGFRVVLTPEDGPTDLDGFPTLHNPDYAPDGSIVFAANWDGDRIWRLLPGTDKPQPIRGDLWWPCVLPDGRIAAAVQDWSREGDTADLHIGVTSPDGSDFVTVTTIMDGGYINGGLGCSI